MENWKDGKQIVATDLFGRTTVRGEMTHDEWKVMNGKWKMENWKDGKQIVATDLSRRTTVRGVMTSDE